MPVDPVGGRGIKQVVGCNLHGPEEKDAREEIKNVRIIATVG
jgi:hypothetical protein